MKKLLPLCMSFSLFPSDLFLGAEPSVNDPYENVMVGENLTPEAAEELEADITKDPNNLSTRTKLLGYYFGPRQRTPEGKKANRSHVLWIIEHYPESWIAGLPYCGIDPHSDPLGYKKAKKLWLEQTDQKDAKAQLLGNAAQFFAISDQKLTEKLYTRASALEPKNPGWLDQLGQHYSRQMDANSAAKALEKFEKAHSIDADQDRKSSRMNDLTKAAFAAQKLEKAASYANETLRMAMARPKDWNTGNAIHHANNALGKIALKQGDTKLAAEYLLKAGRTEGSPQLNSFGPNMSLALELLEQGEKKPVLEYFKLCRDFWKMGEEHLDKWEDLVATGIIPDFGGNLLY